MNVGRETQINTDADVSGKNLQDVLSAKTIQALV